MYQKEHVLNWPIEDDKSESLEKVVVKVMTMGRNRELMKKHKGDDSALTRACICESTGLTVEEVKRLVTPDFNSVQNLVFELLGNKTGEINSEGFDPDSPDLLVPIQSDDGSEKTGYKLRPPTVATTDLMDQHEDEWERTLFVSSSCTGFSQSELERMSLPDWNQLQERLIDFLQRSADYFRQKTLKS